MREERYRPHDVHGSGGQDERGAPDGLVFAFGGEHPRADAEKDDDYKADEGREAGRLTGLVHVRGDWCGVGSWGKSTHLPLRSGSLCADSRG